MTDQRGRSFDSRHLEGRVWVANFMFTTCPDVCPVITQTLAQVQKALAPAGESVQFVSISVDPEIDTPDVLAAFMELHRLDASNWSFITGSPESTEQVVVEGFKQAHEEVPAREGEPRDIRHGTHFVLIDGTGMIRGFYKSRGDGPANLVDDAKKLIQADA
ncbi:SCO family protein [Myxococcota bacterium]|nr:SCO family protein [Myxococcota bacterium]